MVTLLRTVPQDVGYRRWASSLLFIAQQCIQLGIPENGYVFLAAAAWYFGTTTLPSRR